MKRCSVATTGVLETDHIAALERLQGPVTIDRRCADFPELVAVARHARVDAVLVIGDTSGLKRALVEELQHLGLHLVAISNVLGERERLQNLGAVVFADEVSPGVLAQGLMGQETTPEEFEELKLIDVTEFGAGAGFSSEDFSSSPVMPDVTQPGTVEFSGVIAVWGSHGSPGRTTLAVNLAAELLEAGSNPLLIDADTVASSVVAHLGMLEESAGLAVACRQADLGTLNPDVLKSTVTSIEVGNRYLPILTGLPRSRRWQEISSSALTQVIQIARKSYSHVVIDIASPIESEPDQFFELQAPQRNAAALAVLAEADHTFVIGAGDPVSFSRLAKAVEEAMEHGILTDSPLVVINKVRASTAGRLPEEQLAQAWSDLGPDVPLKGFLPWDVDLCDAALRQGRVLSEAGPHSQLREKIRDLIGLSSQTRRRRRLGLRIR